MIIVKFYSGIGNQLYQYAIYKYLKILYPNQMIKADISVFEDVAILNNGNGFAYGFGIPDFFGVNIDLASMSEMKAICPEMVFGKGFRRIFPKFVKKYSGNSRLARLRARLSKKYRVLQEHLFLNAPFNSFNGNLLHLNPDEDYYFDGLWQNYDYLRPMESDLKNELKLKVNMNNSVKDILSEINKTNSVCVHVRRGDFTTPENKFAHDLCGYDYYKKAFSLIETKVNNPSYFLFSDDIEYCKELFKGIENITYVSAIEGLDTKSEMYLMGKCQAAIIPNSTFAFWGVWLGDDNQKTIICPKYILREKTNWAEFSVPDHWIKIDNLR